MATVNSVQEMIDPQSGYCYVEFGGGAVPVRWRRAEADTLYVDATAALAVRTEVVGYFVARDGLGIVRFRATHPNGHGEMDPAMFDLLPLKIDLQGATIENRREYYRLPVDGAEVILRGVNQTTKSVTLVNMSAGGIGVLGDPEYFQTHLLNQCELRMPQGDAELRACVVFVATRQQLHARPDGSVTQRTVLGFEFVPQAPGQVLPERMQALSEADQQKIMRAVNQAQTAARRKQREAQSA